MSGSLRDFLKTAGIAVVTLALLGSLFFGLNKATGFMDKVFGRFDNMSVMVDESDFTRFDGADVSGSSVVDAIKNFQNNGDKVCVRVKTSKSDLPYIYTDQTLKTKSTNNIANTGDKSKDNYINPGARFLGSITRDTNGTIVMVTFEFTGTVNNGTVNP